MWTYHWSPASLSLARREKRRTSNLSSKENSIDLRSKWGRHHLVRKRAPRQPDGEPVLFVSSRIPRLVATTLKRRPKPDEWDSVFWLSSLRALVAEFIWLRAQKLKGKGGTSNQRGGPT